MSVVFAREKYDQIIGEGLPLLERHRLEVAKFPDLMKLEIDADMYRLLEGKDRLYIASARENGELIGYFSIFVNNHHHYKRLLVATEDVIYVRPDHRDPFTGILLLRFGEQAMRTRGCHVIIGRTKVEHDHGRIYQRLGYHPMDTVWIKRLDGG